MNIPAVSTNGEGGDESGYALVAAVASIFLFASVALAIMTATRISIETGRGEIVNARTRLAADAGVAFALHGLMAGDETMVSLLDGRQMRMDFAGASVTIHLTDERGKIPLNHIEAPTIERILTQAGMSGTALAVARDSLQDWQDPDDDTLPDGAEAPFYARNHIAPRNAPLTTVEELGAIRGFSPRIVAALAPFVTVDPAAIPFDPRYAQPRAIEAMSEEAEGSVNAIERRRETEGQRTAFGLADRKAVVGRPVTIGVDADTPGGGHFHREAVVLVTNSPVHPYVIHAVR